MNYQETLDYLYSQLPMFQRVGSKAFKKDLTNTIQLCDALGNPQKQLRCIHIAGTNGKGSTAHAISAVLQAANYKTALYTSPHYRDFRERIKIDGVYIEKEYVVGFVERNRIIFEAIQPSFFEITVAMAFDYFHSQKVDYAVIETGLGGRLDSTNIIAPLISVITNISKDHTNLLGDTLPLIAGEKAGIIKEKTPLVIGKFQEETVDVFRKKAKKMEAPLFFTPQEIPFPFENGLKGPFKEENANTALQSIQVLKTLGISIPQEALEKGFANVKKLSNYIGRWEELGENPKIIADAAHNVGGIQKVMEHLKSISYEQLHVVLGMVNDKDLSDMLSYFPKEAQYYFCKPDIPRGLDEKLMQKQANELGLYGDTYISVNAALLAAKDKAKINDLIYVGGSSFVVAEVV